jgi:capsule polysaccharide modification protein KpsS
MIQEGLLWFDDDPTRDVTETVTHAVQRYQQKYGHSPDVCYVHPGTIPDKEQHICGIVVLQSKSVLPHHFWIGTETVNKSVKAKKQAVQSILTNQVAIESNV